MENKNVVIYNDYLDSIKDQLELEQFSKNALDSSYIFNKLISLCIKKGKKKMAHKQVVLCFNIIKQFFRVSAIFFIKMAILEIEPFIYLHRIPRGNKEIIYPRILPTQTRTHNALYLIVNQAFESRRNFNSMSASLAYSIIDNCTYNNAYSKKVKENIETAELSKRNIKHTKKEKGKQILSKIRRHERFKLFKKIKVWK